MAYKFCTSYGISTLEILIALSLAAVSISAAVALAAGNQIFVVDSEINSDELSMAQASLQSFLATTTNNFNVSPDSPTVKNGYKNSIYRTNNTTCKNTIQSTVRTVSDNVRSQIVTLQSTMYNFSELLALGYDCGGNEPLSSSTSAHLSGNVNFATGGAVSGVDVINKMVFVSTQVSSGTKPVLFVIDAHDSQNLKIEGTLMGNKGANALDVARIGSDYYAFMAMNNSTDQLSVVKIPADDMSHPQVISSSVLPTVDAAGSYPQARSIFYYDSKLYIGTHRTAGREFHIFDVSNPSAPVFLGNKELNHNINGIVVRDQYVSGVFTRLAFLATSGNVKDLIVLNVTDPKNIIELSADDVTLAGTEDTKSIFLLGNTVYLGRYAGTTAAHPDFYMADISNVPVGITILGSRYLDADINGIYVTNGKAFLATMDANKALQILDVSNPQNILPVSASKISGTGTTIDYEDNTIYFGSNTSTSISVLGL